MTTQILNQPDVVSKFVASLIHGCERGFSNATAIGFARDERLVSGVVYHNWQPEAGVIELSAASVTRDWLDKSTLNAIFSYPFDQLKCQMCVARISEHNTRTRRIWRALGATEYKIPRLRGPSEAEIISTLTRETWKSGRFSKEDANGQA